MTEGLNNSDVSNKIYTDIRSAFRSYMRNAGKSVANGNSEDESNTYTNNGQIIRKAFSDVQSNHSVNNQTKKNTNLEIEKTAQSGTQILDDAIQSNRAKVRETEEKKKTEQADSDKEKTGSKQFSLPQNTTAIISELKRNGLYRTMSIYDIAEEYGISYMKAREIMEELHKDNNGFVREYKLSENSTISYKVLG